MRLFFESCGTLEFANINPLLPFNLRDAYEGLSFLTAFSGRDSQGKRQYLNKTIMGKKKDADAYLRTTLTAMSMGNFIELSTLTGDAYLDKWLQTAAHGPLRESTFTGYSELLERYVSPAFGEKWLSELRPLHIQSLYTEMQERGLSARTVR